MLAMLAAAAMTATVAAAPTADPRRPALTFAPTAETCKTNGRFEIADPALLYRDDGRARASLLSQLPKANHEKAVLRVIDGCTAPMVVGYEVGR